MCIINTSQRYNFVDQYSIHTNFFYQHCIHTNYFDCHCIHILLQVVNLGEEPHVNTSLKHFVYFIKEFDLIESKELAPLQELINKLTGSIL